MRLPRFRTYLDAALREDGFAQVDWTEDDQETSLALGLETGARVLLKLVSTSPTGGDDVTKPERIVEGDSAPEVIRIGRPAVDRGRIATRDVELYLRELILAGGSREIARVRSFSSGEARSEQKYGLAVEFHSGAAAYLLFVHTLPARSQPSPQSYYAPLASI